MNKIISKEDFIKVWKDSSKESILNQYYYDYTTLEETIWEAIDYGYNCLKNLEEQEDYLCESIDIVGLLKMIHKNYIKILQGEDNDNR